MRIHGVSQLGADGLAFWLVRNPQRTGDFFGNEYQFTGLGIVVDTYDNDNTGSHPYVFSMWNDGTYTLGSQTHDHVNHATTDRDAALTPGELNGCHAPRLRNSKERVTMRVRYLDNVLTVSYRLPTGGVTMPWDDCLTLPHITIPTGYYFGFTAATGELADDHDIANITIVDLRDSPFSKPFGESLHSSCPTTTTTTTPSQPVGSIGELSTKVDGLTDILRDTLQTLAGRAPQQPMAPVTAGVAAANSAEVLSATRSIQAQLNTVAAQTQESLQIQRQTQAELRTTQARQQQQQPPTPPPKSREDREVKASKGDSHPFLHSVIFLLLLCSAGAAGFFYIQLQRERKQKKLF